MECLGWCCSAFAIPSLNHEEHSKQVKMKQGKSDRFFYDMLIPLSAEEVESEWLRYGVPGKAIMMLSKNYYTCKHWNRETMECMEYDKRPWMCKDYPGKGECSHGCGYCE